MVQVKYRSKDTPSEGEEEGGREGEGRGGGRLEKWVMPVHLKPTVTCANQLRREAHTHLRNFKSHLLVTHLKVSSRWYFLELDTHVLYESQDPHNQDVDVKRYTCESRLALELDRHQFSPLDRPWVIRHSVDDLSHADNLHRGPVLDENWLEQDFSVTELFGVDRDAVILDFAGFFANEPWLATDFRVPPFGGRPQYPSLIATLTFSY